jgi:uncharacterized protein YecT (DUF1311 family)
MMVSRIVTILLTLAICWHSAVAMEFRITWNPQDRINIIIGDGPIESGDASRLEQIISRADRDQYGNIPLYLNSPGGSVKAAFDMVAVIDREEFSALVPSGARCASACASIVFISARFHLVVGTGLLGIHTCYVANQDFPTPDSFCNKVIAYNAVDHGTSYAALQMWQEHKAPDEMAWIGKDVACEYGLCGPPGFDDTLAVPSFDCKASKLQSEIAICSNKRLARYEASIAKYYSQAMKAMPPNERELYRAEQRAWLKYRDSCLEDDACLLQRMKERSNEVVEKWGKYRRTN